MIRKLLALSTTAATVATLAVLALAAGVSQASADTIMLYKAQPDLIVSSATSYNLTVTNVQDLYWPTATAGPFWVYVQRWECSTWWYKWCYTWQRLPDKAFYVPSLAAGAYVTLDFGCCADAVKVTADVWQNVPERDETNNVYDDSPSYW